MDRAPSGEQYGIALGDQWATIVEVGGGVREYTDAGRPVLDPYDVASMCDGAHGTPLIPWPNRLDGGRYTWAGHDYQVALTEPAKNNAIHGFLRWRPWTAQRHEADRVVMATTVFPCGGYPFLLDVAVDYQL
ncbi:MAG: aldose 1-epimerase, partial [Actinomycetota bacterium]|nr:aldose 1-epimerase [Actinomycetota bacterium]